MMKKDPQEEDNTSLLDTVTNLRNRRKSALRMWTMLVLPLSRGSLKYWIDTGRWVQVKVNTLVHVWYKHRKVGTSTCRLVQVQV